MSKNIEKPKSLIHPARVITIHNEPLSFGQYESQCESQWPSANNEISAIRSINLCFYILILMRITYMVDVIT